MATHYEANCKAYKTFLHNIFSNQWSREWFRNIIPSAFQINNLKYLFICPIEFKLHSKTHQTKNNKTFKAKFRCCFSQVQQVKLFFFKLADLQWHAQQVMENFNLIHQFRVFSSPKIQFNWVHFPPLVKPPMWN